jgi:hypothetical protein
MRIMAFLLSVQWMVQQEPCAAPNSERVMVQP